MKWGCSGIIIAKEEQTIPGFMPAKHRLTAHVLKLKPMLIYHLAKHTAFRNYVKTKFPVHWRSHAKASKNDLAAALYQR
jgi:hypothetical protein